MVPKESGFNQSETASSRFPGSPPMTRDGEVKQWQHFYHQVYTICHPKSGYVTTKLHGTSTCRYSNNAMSATLIWPRRSIGSSCQIGNMAALLNSLFFSCLKVRFCLSIVSCIMIIL